MASKHNKSQGYTKTYASKPYQPEPESDPVFPKISFKEAITLITLRLGKLEMVVNDIQHSGISPKTSVSTMNNENVSFIDKDLLLSIITRLDTLEKNHQATKIELQKINQFLGELQTLPEEQMELNLNEQPIIIDLVNRLLILDEKLDLIQNTNETHAIDESDPQEESTPPSSPKDVIDTSPEYSNTLSNTSNTLSNTSNTLSNTITNVPVYNPDFIEPSTPSFVGSFTSPEAAVVPSVVPAVVPLATPLKETIPKTPRVRKPKKTVSI
jgi:hypothetical protein